MLPELLQYPVWWRIPNTRKRLKLKAPHTPTSFCYSDWFKAYLQKYTYDGPSLLSLIEGTKLKFFKCMTIYLGRKRRATSRWRDDSPWGLICSDLFSKRADWRLSDDLFYCDCLVHFCKEKRKRARKTNQNHLMMIAESIPLFFSNFPPDEGTRCISLLQEMSSSSFSK